MCGIAAFLPINNALPNKRFLLSLGMGNEERGTDNSGISFGRTIIKGYGKTSKFRDLYVENKEAIDKLMLKSCPIIIHCRKSTSYNTTCAHPFYFYTENEKKAVKNYIVGCHNGVITNREYLYDKFCNNTSKTILDIDSQYMLVSLLLSDMEEVLKKYEGDAALIFYNKDNFYVWKGGKNDIEERSLYYIKTEEGWYFASTDTNINFNSDYNVVPVSVKNNELLTFSIDGEFISSKIIERKTEYKKYETTTKVKAITSSKYEAPYFITVYKNSLRQIVDRDNNVVNGNFFVYNYSRIYTLYKETSYSGSLPVSCVKGILTKDRAMTESMLRYINRKSFNIVAFLKAYKKEIDKIIIDEMPIIIKNELKFLLKRDPDDTVSCIDMSLAKIKKSDDIRKNFDRIKSHSADEEVEEFYS